MNARPLASLALAGMFLLASAGIAAAIDNDGDGWDSTAGDCNDNDSQIHPGAVELVDDGVDQDCDGGDVCYADADNDGARTFATVASVDVDCSDAFEGRASDPVDCDDANAAVYPGATEVCDPSNTDEDCDGFADDSDPQGASGTTLYYTDGDGDGYGTGGGHLACHAGTIDASQGGDCDDSDTAVNPGATEVCDASNVDEDCDGLADDSDPSTDNSGKTTFYPDDDADGHGQSTGALRCHASAPYTALVGDDCDDSNGAAYPGATEVCDPSDVDEDCDGLADDDDPDAAGKSAWYEDIDGDGFGAAGGSAVEACNAPPQHVMDNSDCDDGSGAIHPGATEVCDAMDVDEDCDGLADDADSSATGKTAYYADGDGDGYGAATIQLRCDPAMGLITSSGDCDDTNASVNPAASEVCSGGADDDCNGSIDCADAACSADVACEVQVFDHLECFKVKASDKWKATVTLDPGTRDHFTVAAGCTIVKATKYCVPVMKTVTALDAGVTPNPSYVGQQLENDRICYKVKCPAAAVPAVTVEDQFGTHTVTGFKVSEICTPADVAP